MQNRESMRIWPILYFQAEWPLQSYDFEFGVRLIKADKTLLNEITEYADNNCWTSNIEGSEVVRNNTEWFLAIRPPEVTEHVPVNEKGMSFVNILQRDIVDSFLLCLQLVRSTAAVCPYDFPAEVHGDIIEEVDTNTDDYYGVHAEKPHAHFTETLTIEDLQLLAFLWPLLVKLRKLDSWTELINKEEFFADCDKRAGKIATERLVDFFIMHSHSAAASEEERKQLRNFVKESLDNGEIRDIWNQFYRGSFSDVYKEKHEEIVFSNRTRIGRALNLFYEGLHLPILHSFLSMCLVWETLFTIGSGETVYKLTLRLAKMVGLDDNLEKRMELYTKAKIVYNKRSEIVHGEKLIDTVSDSILRDGFALARQSLQCILLSNEFWELYSHPGTTDKQLKGKGKGRVKDEASKALSDFFLRLELSK